MSATKPDDRTRARVAALHGSGVPSSVIARRLGIARADVNHIIKERIQKGRKNGNL